MAPYQADELADDSNMLFVFCKSMVDAAIDEGLFSLVDYDIDQNLCPVFFGLPVSDFGHHFVLGAIFGGLHNTPVR